MQTATLASRFSGTSLNRNSSFQQPDPAWVFDWGNKTPAEWSFWSADNGVYIGPSQQANFYGPASPLQIDRNSGHSGVMQVLNVSGRGWYVLECDVTLEDGPQRGAGMHVNFNNGFAHILDFARDPDTSGTVGDTGNGNRKFSKMVWNGSSSTQTNLYMMAGWAGFQDANTSGFLRTIWHKAVLRPATQPEIDGRQAKFDSAANAAEISTTKQTLATVQGSVASLQSEMLVRSTGAGNLLSDTDFSRWGGVSNDNWWSFSGGGFVIGGLGLDLAGYDWRPGGELPMTVREEGRTAGASFSFVSPVCSIDSRFPIQFYCYVAAHRAQAEVFLEYHNASGAIIGYAPTGASAVLEGGRNPNNWSILGLKSTVAPSDAVSCRLLIRKYATNEGAGDSYMWIWRPYLGAAAPGQTAWNPWQAGSAYGLAKTLTARIQDEAVIAANANQAVANRTSTLETKVDGHNGLTARTGIVESAVSNLQSGQASARLVLSAVTAGGVAQISLVSNNNGGAAVEIVGNVSISGQKLQDGTVGAGKLTVGELSAITANLGTVTAGVVRSADGLTEFNLNTGRQKFVTGGYRLVQGANLGPSANMVLWYGPTSVAEGQETIANSAFALATDGKIYQGSAQINAAGKAAQTVGIGVGITRVLGVGESVSLEASVGVTGATASGTLVCQIQVDGVVNKESAGAYIGPNEPAAAYIPATTYTNNTGIRRAFTFRAQPNSAWGGTTNPALSWLTVG